MIRGRPKAYDREFFKAITGLKEENCDNVRHCQDAVEHNVLSPVEREEGKVTDRTAIDIVAGSLGIAVFSKIVNVTNMNSLGHHWHHEECQQQPCDEAPLRAMFVIIHQFQYLVAKIQGFRI